jgi:hypothetical protein
MAAAEGVSVGPGMHTALESLAPYPVVSLLCEHWSALDLAGVPVALAAG